MALSDDELKFIDELDELIESAMLNGVCTEFITSSLEDRGTDLTTGKWTRAINLAIKCWVVAFCSLMPAAIWGWKFYASITERKFIDDPWLNIVCLISLLAVVAQFFDLKSVLPVLDRLIKAWRRK